MKIVAIDFSFTQRRVAAMNGEVCIEVLEEDPKKTNILGMITEAMSRAGLSRQEIECVAVGLGPGSYTGIRASIAMAQGWQLAAGVKLLGVSSAEVVAAQAQREGLRGPVNVVIDAQRGEFYLGRFDLGDKEVVVTAPLRIVSAEEAGQSATTGPIIGPEVTRWFPEGRLISPRADTLARLASSRIDFVSGEKLEPIYLRETTFVKAPPARVIPTT